MVAKKALNWYYASCADVRAMLMHHVDKADLWRMVGGCAAVEPETTGAYPAVCC